LTPVNKLKELLAKLKAHDEKIDALLAHDELTAEQQADYDRLVGERASTLAAYNREKDRVAREEEREQLEASTADRERRTVASTPSTSPPAQRRTTPDTPKIPAVASAPKRKLPSGIEVEERWINDPSKGFSSHVEFLRAVMDAGQGQRVDSRLRPLAMAHHREEEDAPRGADYLVPLAFTPSVSRTSMIDALTRQATAGSDEAGTYSDPYGGVLVGKSFRPDLLKVMPEGDPMGQYTTKVPMDTPTVEIPARVDKNHTSSVSGGLRVYRRAETQTASSSRMELETVELKASALFGTAYATEELLARSLISFLAILKAGFSDEFNSKLIRERLEGTGVGQYEGVLNTDCIVSVAKETGQAADTLLKENIDKMVSRCWRYGVAIWLANHDCIPQLMSLTQTVGTGGVPVSYFQMQPGGQASLLGRPLFFSEYMPKIGDTGDLLLGNWAEYLEGTLSPLQNSESMHVRFLEHERTFKFWMENAGKVWWRSALTPAKSAQTLSPFVKLDAR
jgi:HK97 family phage major capsid protein